MGMNLLIAMMRLNEEVMVLVVLVAMMLLYGLHSQNCFPNRWRGGVSSRDPQARRFLLGSEGIWNSLCPQGIQEL